MIDLIGEVEERAGQLEAGTWAPSGVARRSAAAVLEAGVSASGIRSVLEDQSAGELSDLLEKIADVLDLPVFHESTSRARLIAGLGGLLAGIAREGLIE